ncbi:MAG: hypothetical protein UX72_C0030G0007 [Parcubacteria group bacterium GW2011_GWA2_47_10]|nr:MAG: hypothetical protein UX72_C0030G0007 [Parcubacteria group bacterium GW2011_GWA2_47_10]
MVYKFTARLGYPSFLIGVYESNKNKNRSHERFCFYMRIKSYFLFPSQTILGPPVIFGQARCLIEI